MKRIALFGLAALMFIGELRASQSAFVVRDGVAAYAGMDDQAAPVATFMRNQKVAVLEKYSVQSGKWSKVQLSGGRVAYIKNNDLIDRPLEKIIGGKGLVPVPAANQSVERIKGNFLFLSEKRNGVSVEVSLDEQPDSLQLVIGVENNSLEAVTVDSEKVFLVNANNRALLRRTDQEVPIVLYGASKALVNSMGARPKYSVEPDGLGGYRIREDGFDQTVNQFAASLRTWKNQRDARKALEEMERDLETEHYLADEIIQPKSFVLRRVIFEPLYASTADPMRVLLSLNDQLFIFQFQ